MNNHDKSTALTALLAITLTFANQGLQAQTALDETITDPILADEPLVTDSGETVVTSQGQVVNKLSSEFADFLGGEEQARELITDLRENGLEPPQLEAPVDDPAATEPTEPVTEPVASEPAPTDEALASEAPTDPALSDPVGTEPVATEPVSTEPAKQLGYGEIRHTLKLAQAELLKLDITQPTDSELYAMLYGGELNGASVDGILAMRADGMGWGQIAKAYDFKLGQLYGKGHVNKPVASTTATTSGKGVMKGYIPSGKTTGAHAYGRGLVSAGGSHVSGSTGKAQTGKGLGHAKSGGSKFVSAAGGGAAGHGLASAQGGSAGKGLAKGRYK